MNTQKIQSKIEIVADVMQMSGGELVLRPRAGRTLKLGRVADTIRQPDGNHRLTPHPEWIAMDKAMKILDLPYSTLRRAVENQALAAYKKSPFRWAVSLESVMELKRRAQVEPEFWGGHPRNKKKRAVQLTAKNSRPQKRKNKPVNRRLRRGIKPIQTRSR